jgi:hypothetical protein
MSVPLYPGSVITPNLGLSLVGMDEVIAEDFVLVDAAIGGISSGPTIEVNGVPTTVQTLLNLIAGTNVTLVADAFGGVTINSSGGGGGSVTSVFGRTGAVVAQTGDYTYAQISGTPQLAQTFAAVAHEWLNSYSSITGLFTATQPAYTDISGTPQLAQTFAPVANEFIMGYSATTGLFTAAQPSAANLSNGTTGTGAVVLASAIAGFGDGTVTSFSAGNIDTIVTSSVATPTTTPALTFALNTQAANTAWMGPVSGPAAAPTFRAITAADLPQAAQTFAAVAHEWLNSYSATTGLFTATQPAASDLSNGTTGSGAVVLAGSPAITGTMSVVNESISGTLADGTASVGTSGQILSSTGTGTLWITNAGGTPTFPLTVAGTVVSGGIPYFNSTTQESSSALLTSGSPVLGGGAGVAPKTATFLTTTGTTTLVIGVAAGGNGVLSLAGTTSGHATFTAPSVAGTTTNSVTSSNNLTAPEFLTNANGTAAAPAFAISTNGTGMFIDPNGATDVLAFSLFTVAPFAVGALNNSSATTLIAAAVAGWSSTATVHGALDTGISRLAAASFAFGNGTAGDFSAALKCGTINATSSSQSMIGALAFITGNTAASSSPSIRVNAASQDIILNAGGANSIILNYDTGTGGTLFGNGSSTVVAGVNSLGVFSSGAGTGVTAGPFVTITSITTTGGIVTALSGTSDERLKIAQPYEGGLDELLGINPIRFRYNEKGQAQTGLSGEQYFVGFGARNVQKEIPEAITGTEKSKDGTETYLSLDDRPILALAVNAIKELAAQRAVDRLEIDSLRAEMKFRAAFNELKKGQA